MMQCDYVAQGTHLIIINHYKLNDQDVSMLYAYLCYFYIRYI